MEHKIFTVYDEKAKAFLPPFFLPQIGMGTRVFSDCVNDPTHQFNKHPADYNLYHIGEFDDNSGKIIVMDPRNLLGSGVMFKDPDQLTLEDIPDAISNDPPIQPGTEG